MYWPLKIFTPNENGNRDNSDTEENSKSGNSKKTNKQKTATTTTKNKHRNKTRKTTLYISPWKRCFGSKEISSVKYQLLCYRTLRGYENNVITIKTFRPILTWNINFVLLDLRIHRIPTTFHTVSNVWNKSQKESFSSLIF